MITITKQNDGVLFEFEDSKKYLYGNGSILVPFNTLSIVADESDMITLKKAASNDVFLSARYDTDFGYRSKDDAIEDLKDMLFAETGGGGGGGVTSGEVQTMIDESISGKADTSVVNQAISEATQAILSVSGDVQTKADASALTAHTANTTVHVTSVEKGVWNAKQDALHIYTENNNLGTAELHSNDSSIIFNAGGASITANNAMGVNTFNVEATGVTINNENVATEPYVDAATSGKVNTSAITTAITSGSTDSEIPTAKATYDAIQAGGGGSANVIELTQAQYDALTTIDPDAIYVITDATAYDPSTKVDTSAITTSITSGSTDSEIPTAKATYDAIQAGGGGGATYSAGTNISIDTANTINCTLPITIKAGTGDNKNLSIFSTGNTFDSGRRNGVIIGRSNTSNGDFVFVIGENNSASDNYAFSQGKRNNSTKSYSATFGFYVNSNNAYEMSCGSYNNSVTALTESGQTLFSVGNGTANNARHNAFEIRHNGDIYFPDTDNTTYQNFYEKPMVRLQDMYGALGGLKLVKLTQAEYDQLATKDNDTLYIISNVVS